MRSGLIGDQSDLTEQRAVSENESFHNTPLELLLIPSDHIHCQSISVLYVGFLQIRMVTAKEVFIDYHLVDIIFLLILIGFWTCLQRGNPNRLFVPKRDPRCSYPHYDSGIKEFTNLIICVIVPYVVYIIMYAIIKAKGLLSGMVPFDFIYALVGHGGCVIMANIVANILKLQVGRPRPDFFAVLGVQANSETGIPDDMTVKAYQECFKSFPSGHTTTACCGTLFLVLFLQSGVISNQFTVFFLKCVPLMYAFYIGAMRITEHRHHFEDVLAGMVIGFLFPVVFFLGQHDRLFTDVVKP